MTPGANPNGPGGEDQREIHLQRGNSRPSTGRATDHPDSFLIPGEVFAPTLAAWVEERGRLAAFRIRRVAAIRFETVAGSAGQAEVFRGALAAQ